MQLEDIGGFLAAGWLVFAIVAWLRARASRDSVFEYLPWWASMLGAIGFFLLLDGFDALFWLAVALLCLGWGVLSLRARFAPRRELTTEEVERMDASIQRLVDTLEGRGEVDHRAAYDFEARSLKFSLWTAAICAGIAVALLAWVSANIRGDTGFGGIVFLIGIGLPGVLSLAGIYAALQSLFKMGKYKRLMAEQAAVGELPEDKEPQWRS